MRAIAGAILLLLFGLQVAAIAWGANRSLHVDEVEYLHAGWLMAKGEELYTSFFEHHPPFLFAVLEQLASDDVAAYVVRARWISGVCGLVALGSFASILWRVRPEAAAIAVALLFGSSTLWESALASVRAEPFALAFFWGGAALVLLARENPAWTGVGAGFVAIAALWNPKWPLCSAVMIVFWLAGTRRRALSAAVAIALTSISLLAMHAIASLDRVWFFSVEFTRALWPWLARSPETLRQIRGGEPFLFAPTLLGPFAMVAAFAVVAASLRRVETKRIPLVFLLLALASALELRLAFPWPVIWRYYYVMWGFAVAALIGLTPLAAERILRRRSGAVALALVLLIVAGAHIIAMMPFRTAGDPWVAHRYLLQRLSGGETVLLDLTRHPIAARDAGYYWFGHGYVPEVAEMLRSTPRGSRFLPPRSHPFCEPPEGLRFVASARTLRAPAREQRCFDESIAAGRLRATPFADVYEAVR